jgi:hypothetical protein
VTDRHLRARVLLGEARELGISLADLIAADTAPEAPMPTVAGYIETIAATFTPGTAATYRPYWRLAAVRLGDRRLDDIAVADLQSSSTTRPAAPDAADPTAPDAPPRRAA